MTLLEITVFVILVFSPCGQSTASWSYNGINGEDQWWENYPLCAGKSQSPINFKSELLKYNSYLPPIKPQNYNLSPMERLTFTNNGNTATIVLPSQMSLSGLPGHYSASDLHFHWGSTSTQIGSEHTVNGMRFPAEMHVVHYNSDRYHSVSEAQNQTDGLAVLGVFIQVGAFNPAFDQFLKYLSNIKYADQSVQIPGFNIQQLLPDDLKDYYQYAGSLTTPPCYPSVLWTVFRNPVTISMNQYMALAGGLFSSRPTDFSPHHLSKNYRKLQHPDNRVVQVSFNDAASTSQPKKSHVHRCQPHCWSNVRELKQRSLDVKKGMTNHMKNNGGKVIAGENHSKKTQPVANKKKHGVKNFKQILSVPILNILNFGNPTKPELKKPNQKPALGKTTKHDTGKPTKHEIGKTIKHVPGKPIKTVPGEPMINVFGKPTKHHLAKPTTQPFHTLPSDILTTLPLDTLDTQPLDAQRPYLQLTTTTYFKLPSTAKIPSPNDQASDESHS